MYTYQVRYNGTIIDTTPMQFNPRYQFVIVIPNEDANNTVENFTLRGVAVDVLIKTPIYKELDTLSMYEITSSLF